MMPITQRISIGLHKEVDEALKRIPRSDVDPVARTVRILFQEAVLAVDKFIERHGRPPGEGGVGSMTRFRFKIEDGVRSRWGELLDAVAAEEQAIDEVLKMATKVAESESDAP